MKNLKKIIAALAIVAGIGMASQQGYSYSFNAWTTTTGEKTFIINPLYSSIQNKTAAVSVLNTTFLYGFTKTVDIIFVPAQLTFAQWDAAAGDTAQKGKYTGSWAMPRYDLGDNNILALGLSYIHQPIVGAKDSYVIAPQYHFTFDKENVPVTFEANLGYQYYTESTLNGSNLFLIAAASYKVVPGSFSIVLEVDPTYYTKGDATVGNFGNSGPKGLYVTVIPEIWIGLAGGKYQFSAGVQFINVVKPSGYVKDGLSDSNMGFVFGFSYTF